MAKRTCVICGGPHVARGWCSPHYQAWVKYGDPLAGGHKTGRHRDVCKIEGCGEVRAGLGWCSAHYSNFRRHGDPEYVPVSPGRIYVLDDYFFDVIDTEAKAYWLGFVAADGCVRTGPQGAAGWQMNSLAVKLQPGDAGHLEKMRADLRAESPVQVIPKSATDFGRSAIVFSSRRLVESLIALGITPRKSLTLEPWAGPPELMRHYWRGAFDGDGTLVKHPGERDKWHLRMLGSEAVVEAFRVWASAISGSKAAKYPKVSIWSWTAGGLASPQVIVRELYGDATVYLDRKYELAQQLMAAPIRHRTWLRID